MSNKVWNFFSVVLFGYSLFIAGSNFADNKPAIGTLNLILAALWLSLLVVEWLDRGLQIKILQRRDNTAEKFFHSLINAIELAESELKTEPANKPNRKTAPRRKSATTKATPSKIKKVNTAKKPVTKKGRK